jgi:hypothetical protein
MKQAFGRGLGIVFHSSLILGACGGAGGSGSGGFYAGVWDFVGAKFVDDCNTGAPGSTSITLTVNQDGRDVVVNSGNVTLTGTTNQDDGFTVTASLPGSNGCAGAASYVFKNASDGNADVGVGIAVRCGVTQCTVAYGGPATRRSERQALEGPGLDLEHVVEALERRCSEKPQQRDGVSETLNSSVESAAVKLAEVAAGLAR